MKPHTNSLRQQVYAILKASPKKMSSRDIAEVMNTTTHELANTLRNMMHDPGNYPGFRRKRMKAGWMYSTSTHDESAPPAHPVFTDLWRGWGNADRLGDGNADEFFRRMNRD